MDLSKSLTNNLFTQCVNLVGSETNQKKLRSHVIDPLIGYFKYKLRIFFVVIIILLSCILIANILMIGYFTNLRTMIKTNPNVSLGM